LVEIDCSSSSPPRELEKTFESYLKESEQNDETALRLFDAIDVLLKESKNTYDHIVGGKPPRAHQWRVVRSCVHDRVVGLAALRQNDRTDSTEVDLFEISDHPLYAKGHGVRSLLALVYSDAYKAGSSMRLQFRKVAGFRGAAIPAEIVDFAATHGLTLSTSSNTIGEEDGALLYAAAVGLELHTALRIVSNRTLSLDAVSFLAATQVWNIDEIQWLIDNCADAQRVLFGLNDAKDWLLFGGSLAWARAAILATMFRAALNDGGEEGVEASVMRGAYPHLELRLTAASTLPWLEPAQRLRAGEVIAVLPRPRRTLSFEPSILIGEAKALAHGAPSASVRVILQAADTARSDIQPTTSALDELGVAVLISPYSISDLDHLAEDRFARARRVRR
jgi:hypothetical protein